MNAPLPSASLEARPAAVAGDFRSAVDPIWCPGCGHHAVLLSVTAALAESGVPHEDIAFISGIGCSSRIPAYTNVYGFHGVHGRALALATGVKMARPDLTVLVAGGDGDGLSIGGNHFLHACRRNVDLTYVLMDNEVYGMTKGQASPTTTPDWCGSKLTPDGTGVAAADPVKLAVAAGAGFVARGFAGNTKETAALILAGMRHHGFSFIHVLSPCVTYRPEQRGWRKLVHATTEPPATTQGEALAAVGRDDGFTTGLLYVDGRPGFSLERQERTTVADLGRRFVVPAA
jgi:2-oxoglutarate ferredoxin oxidoreductase subunit beta